MSCACYANLFWSNKTATICPAPPSPAGFSRGEHYAHFGKKCHDAPTQLIRVNDPHENATWVYNYDRGGNIISKVKYAYSTGTVGTALETIPYAYGDANWKDKLTAYNGTAITYDAIGNPLNDGSWTYEWALGRQLKKMSKPDKEIEFKYDFNGLRTQKIVTENGVTTTTNYLLHGKLVTHMTVGNDKLHFFYDNSSRPAKVDFNGTIYTYLHNLQGDIVGILDNNRALVVEYKYDAWGKLLATTGSLAATLGKRNPFRYRGYVYDEETELYYLRSRYYNPTIERFVNADTRMGGISLMGKNMYVYCSNSPAVYSDHNGFSPEISPSPSRPENWDTDFYTRMCRQHFQATVKRVTKTISDAVKSGIEGVKEFVKNVVLVIRASQLAQHGGGIIEFTSGLKATCYTSEYWYKLNRPESEWGSVALDIGLAGAGKLAGKVASLAKFSPCIEVIGYVMVGIDVCNNMQIDQINGCINTSGSIGWINWERSMNCAPMPTAWSSTMFTPTEWFGEIESVEFFE